MTLILKVHGHTIIVETVPTDDDVLDIAAYLGGPRDLFAEWMREVEYDWDHGGALDCRRQSDWLQYLYEIGYERR